MEIIGIDHGYAAIKTKHFCFPSGVVEYEYEPYTQKDVLEFGGKYYVCGSGRQPLRKDKTVNDSYYLLTLAAIAKELSYRNIFGDASVLIAAGLPLAGFGREKNAFRRYLLRSPQPVSFCFEGKAYRVEIVDVSLFPQGYAAVLSHMEILRAEPSVILADIGGWTVDVMLLNHAMPDASTCRSLELGMIRCINEIQEQIRRSLGISLTQAQIETALAGKAGGMPAKAMQLIEKEGRAYTARLFSLMDESGFDVRAMPVILMGGGAAITGARVAPQDGLCRLITLPDVCANATGYERLAGQIRDLSHG